MIRRLIITVSSDKQIQDGWVPVSVSHLLTHAAVFITASMSTIMKEKHPARRCKTSYEVVAEIFDGGCKESCPERVHLIVAAGSATLSSNGYVRMV